ncbi:Major Facilitator Superfamily [Methanocella conradii HZ254]|uniref:Major Facilitator Superfamily n=1 Tax=Methanocella conradii (strain DSM 24694 / JCM 17849 / CGMCC 1.5162 / HZ254) TaxID=1041930 RepID=H8I9L1_METCZ|nr:MFS transporter [Methanocella conradii]AFD00056.1 Major Facilitator Superfamily [Methanocella conradii HZ254]MDI6896124.1 MFS transporter [Methanocella conradii]
MTISLDIGGFTSRFDRQVWGLFGASIIGVLGTSLVMTFMSIYMYESLGMSMTQVGLADFITTIVGAGAAYLGGAACDAYGRKKLLIIGLTLQIISYLLISICIDTHVAIPLFILALAFNSFNGGLYRTIPDVMIADVVKPSDLVEAYGLIRIGSNMGWVIGPVLGGAFLMFTSYGNLFYITALTTLTYLLIAAFLLRDTRPKLQPERLRLKDIAVVAGDRPFLAFCLLMLFMIIPYQQMYTLFTVYSSAYVGLSSFWIGVLYALSGLMVALFQYRVSSEVNKYKMTSALAFSAAVFAIGFFMLSLSTAFIVPFIGMAIITFAEMIWSPASSTMQANLSPESMRGRYFGFNGLTGNIGWAVGPLFGGILKDSMGGNVPMMWAIIGSMFILCVVGFMGLDRVVSKRANMANKIEKIGAEG